MEPRRSLTNYAVALAILLPAVSCVGLWPLAVGLAVIVIFGGWALRRSYRRWWAGEAASGPRAKLDRLVRRQWVASGGVGLAVAVAVGATGVRMLDGGTFVGAVQAVASAAAVALTAVFVSSLVDWYWILPRVGGLGEHLAPCEAPGERWKYTTAIWLFHRGLATALVVASIAAVPFYLAATLGTPATKAILGIIGVAVGGGMAALNQRGLAALTNAFNQSINVGDTILVDQPGEGEGASSIRRRAYVVDVSVQGLKYQLLLGENYAGPRFERRGHGPVPQGDEYRAIARADGPAAAPCRDGCGGVNWYCRHNPRAYDF